MGVYAKRGVRPAPPEAAAPAEWALRERPAPPTGSAPQERAAEGESLLRVPLHGPSGPPQEGRGRPLPPVLKTRLEALSGVPLDDVTVHYGSPAPGRLQAAAFTAGSEIHVGPGQERHLAHEAWHAVQQKQGRVPAAGLLGGRRANESPALEREADRVGAGAGAGLGMRRGLFGAASASGPPVLQPKRVGFTGKPPLDLVLPDDFFGARLGGDYYHFIDNGEAQFELFENLRQLGLHNFHIRVTTGPRSVLETERFTHTGFHVTAKTRRGDASHYYFDLNTATRTFGACHSDSHIEGALGTLLDAFCPAFGLYLLSRIQGTAAPTAAPDLKPFVQQINEMREQQKEQERQAREQQEKDRQEREQREKEDAEAEQRRKDRKRKDKHKKKKKKHKKKHKKKSKAERSDDSDSSDSDSDSDSSSSSGKERHRKKKKQRRHHEPERHPEGALVRDEDSDVPVGVAYEERAFTVEDVPANGDCFFIACARFVNDGRSAADLRQALGARLGGVRGARVARAREYADLDDMRDMAALLGITIVIHQGSYDRNVVQRLPSLGAGARILNILFLVDSYDGQGHVSILNPV